jgi:predicted CoA-substrate-specific enzyme activase
VLYDGALVDAVTIPTGWNSREAAERALGDLLAPRGLSRGDLGHLVATGYGRGAVAEADARITEITCHALGAAHLFPKVRFVLDIGGQDSKVIALDGAGRVTDFLMNDKCAAGTGRFLHVMAAHLEYELEDFSRLPDDLEPLAVSSMCTVFAESEVVGLLAGGADKAALALGLLDAVAGRACGMLAKLGVRDAVAFTGGVSKSRNLAALLDGDSGFPFSPRRIPRSPARSARPWPPSPGRRKAPGPGREDVERRTRPSSACPSSHRSFFGLFTSGWDDILRGGCAVMGKAKDKSDDTRNDKDVSTEEALGTRVRPPVTPGGRTFPGAGPARPPETLFCAPWEWCGRP